MFIGSLGSTDALRQEGNVVCRLRPHTIALPSWQRAGPVVLYSMNIALLPQGRDPFEMSNLESTNFRWWTRGVVPAAPL
jgi:hypothetical protein